MPLKTDREGAVRFLVDAHAGRRVHLNALQRLKAGKGRLIGASFGPDEVERMGAWIESNNRAKACVYWMPNEPDAELRQGRARHRFDEASIAAVRYAFVDVDPLDGESPADVQARMLPKVRAFRLPPTFTVCSGRGLQLFWRLRPTPDAKVDGLTRDLRIDADPARVEEARAINQGLIEEFGGKAAGADKCFSLEHLYRVPGTIHWKRENGQSALAAYVIEADSHPSASYAPSEFLRLPKTSQSPAVRARSASTTATAPARGPVYAEDLREWAASTGKTIPDLVLAIVVQGRDFELTAYPSRSEALWAALCGLVRAGVPDGLILGAITTPDNLVSACVVDKPRPEDEARRQLEKAHAAVAADQAQHGDDDLAQMNRLHAVVTSGRVRVLSWRSTHPRIDREAPDLQSFEDLRNRYRHQKVVDGTDKQGNPIYKRKSDWWIDHPHRREIKGICFAPGEPADVDGFQNLWRGWGVEPIAGDWSLMRAHVLTILASGSAEHADYIIRWAAWAVQNPEKQAEAALVFRGGQGTGKGFFGRTLKELFGQHGLHITSAKHLTGDFNLHLRDCCLLFADEAIAPGDKGAESRLKGLITEPELTIEGKGENLVTEPNHLHVVMASNESWVVPAQADERRYAVFDVSSARAQDRDYFAALADQLNRGGRAAMLHELQAMPLGEWHPRTNIPQTDGLARQKVEGLHGFEAYAFDMLVSDDWPVERDINGYRFVPSAELLHEAKKWLQGKPGVNHFTLNTVQAVMHDLLGCTKHRISGGRNGYLLREPDEMRARWSAARFAWKWRALDSAPVVRGPASPF
jgi:hypothetical protein